MSTQINSLAKYIAWFWLLIVAILFVVNGYLWVSKRIAPNTNILALLPSEQRNPVLQAAFSHMVDTAQQRIIVLVGAKDWPQAVKAADAYTAVINTRTDILQIDTAGFDQTQTAWLNLFTKSRLGLLTFEQQNKLRSRSSSYWVDMALSRLYSPFAGVKLTAWQDDPVGLFADWWQAHASETPVRPQEGKLYIGTTEHAYVVLMLNLNRPAFAISTQKIVMPLLKQAAEAAQQAVANVELITSGVILYAAAASAQAHQEVATIGIGSLLGVLLLIWLTFRSFKPIFLIAISLAVGCLAALAVCIFIFGQIHLLTFVFGASLIGIAQDYAIYFLCSQKPLKKLWPGLCLTLAAALIGYFGLALTPFPGLRQMAVFSSIGLIFAWLTVVCWFPIVVKTTTFKVTKLANVYNNTRICWPVLRMNRLTGVIAFLLVAIIIFGWSRLTVSDDIRALQKPVPALINDQLKLNKLLDVPSPVQFYLVQGATPEIVLQREEALTAQLQPLLKQHIISGYQAISSWIPSLQMQKNNQALIKQTLLINDGPLVKLAHRLDENNEWITKITANLNAATLLLTPDVFLNMPNSEPWHYLWLGQTQGQYASIVAIRGLSNYGNLPLLQQLAIQVEGVQWVDKINSISTVLGNYRHYMSWALVLAYGAIYLLLWLRYQTAAWRVLVVPAIASIITLAVIGIFGIPLQLFHVLALMLILGLGVDYGIFLREQPDKLQSYAWLTVGLSAISASLSFGLLALSKTPPLHAFGLTMLIGMALVWVLAPVFADI